ncbi:unnamed protein product [Prorocentrum cordatum]|uniref:C3H1-type domain-containing protein n=1 Tax=Prorocentrum cordatum TaxID=2364126 RepID=A0ABN9UXN3_9DINO|nr:unnamed protein product [Polarella glacialis]
MSTLWAKEKEKGRANGRSSDRGGHGGTIEVGSSSSRSRSRRSGSCQVVACSGSGSTSSSSSRERSKRKKKKKKGKKKRKASSTSSRSRSRRKRQKLESSIADSVAAALKRASRASPLGSPAIGNLGISAVPVWIKDRPDTSKLGMDLQTGGSERSLPMSQAGGPDDKLSLTNGICMEYPRGLCQRSNCPFKHLAAVR